MNTVKILAKSKLFLKNNSPTLLSIVGAAGVVATAVTAVRATPKALVLIEAEEHVKWMEEEPSTSLTPMEIVKVAWKPYIPSILIGGATIACVFGANALNQRQQASLASAYALLDRSYKEYKNKVKEALGEEKEKEVQKAIIKERLDDIEDITQLGLGAETLMFFEEHHGQIFERTMLEVREAEYQLNRRITTEGEASLNHFLEYLDLPGVAGGDTIGWSQEDAFDSYSHSWIDFDHELVQMDDGMECYIITPALAPNILVPF